MDRELQRELLERMRAVYPDRLREYPTGQRRMSRTVAQAAHYLREHGLVDGKLNGLIWRDVTEYEWGLGLCITAAGLDFLADDGGLTAILQVVTVKLHADTIRDLLFAKISTSDLPLEKKAGMKAALAKLSGTALQAATGDLVKMGLEHGPDAVRWIEQLVSTIS